MEYHEIDSKGKLWIERVATLPTWTSSDVGRLVYAIDEDKFYKASSTEWQEFGQALTLFSGGVIAPPSFDYNSTTSITITPARFHHYGTKEQIVFWNSTLTFTFGPAGSNAASSALGTSQWLYLYIDDSAVVTLDSNILTAAQLIAVTTEPSFNPTAGGYYNGNDRCIGAFWVNSSGNINIFYHNRDYIEFDSAYQPSSGWSNFYPGNSWTFQATCRAPSFCNLVQMTLWTSPARCGRYQAYYRQGSSTGTGHLIGDGRNTGSGDNAETRGVNQFKAFIDGSQEFDLKVNTTDTRTGLYLYQNGFYLPYYI
jgi:hypothetical protein